MKEGITVGSDATQHSHILKARCVELTEENVAEILLSNASENQRHNQNMHGVVAVMGK